ncbi:hypothetical protein PIB30_093184, partial [Stylosanthes scabra]|nr:hypothetical protein [Stylosanthes scabra]
EACGARNGVLERPEPKLRQRQSTPRRGSQSLGVAKLEPSLQDHSSQRLGVDSKV